ncbi:MAG TPA: RNA-binding S4 domain-containing protein [Paenibacillaceae bacterium]
MRLDKFLKVSRLIKRRTVAKDVSRQGRVLLNGREAKPGSEVKPGDVLEIRFGRRVLTVRVERTEESVRKDEAREMYTVLREEEIEEPFP